jgi:dTDP-glucose 4,6-dehydratase
MRILITGGCGFQGSHLAELWVDAGHDITILNTYSKVSLRNIEAISDRITLVWGSITDFEVVEKTVRGHEVVVHLAARVSVDDSIDHPSTFLTANVMGTHNVLEAIRSTGARLVFASTCEVYGAEQSTPANETQELRPHSPYAASKAAADRLCFAYYKTYGVDVTIVRPSNVYGKRQKSGSGGALIPILTEMAMAGRPLTVFGDGQQRREYINVDDLIAAYDLILGSGDLTGETVNVGSGEVVSVKEVAEHIATVFGVDIDYRPARLGEVSGFRLDSTKSRQLGFVPAVKFWDGLAGYLEWRQNACAG